MPPKKSAEDIETSAPPEINPYEVLSVEKTATDAEIRSAYRKLALKTHPDKVTEENKKSAHETFQKVAFAYAVLSDEKRRARYDRTGRTDEGVLNGNDVDDEDFDWESFYKEMWADVVNGDVLEQFKKTYKGSDEEKDDLLAAYKEGEGSMDFIFENVMLSDVIDDEERFTKIIKDAIASGDVESYDAFTKETKKQKQQRRKNAKDEAKEAEEYAKELGVHEKLFGKSEETSKTGKGGKKGKKESNPEDDPNHPLAALIRSRQTSRVGRMNSFFDNLEAKYAEPATGKGKKRSRVDAEPSEEEFLAAQSKVSNGKRKSKR